MPQARPNESMLPVLTAILELPEMLDPDGPANSRVNRIHSRAVKTSLRRTLGLHHKVRIPQHFRRDARHRYRYHERKRVTKRIKRKRYHSITDLVKTGATKRKMIAGFESIRVGGSTEGGTVTGTMRLRFPFPTSNEWRGDGVTPDKMAEEIARFTDEETKQVANQFKAFYVDEINKNLTSRRVRKRIAGRLSRLGITP